MRVARLVGLSPDGRFVIVATERGEELAIAADDRLRAALRGDRPRLGQLEIDMESALSPREIQTRIRSGESVADVAQVAGVDRERVERFAAPVIAEREHMAGLAMTSSARRRGETSAHRTLRGVLNERLLNRGVDIDTVGWDSYRLDDGRWAITADYLSGETPRRAVFYFDVAGRYSVAGNDEGRWVLGDVSPHRGAQPDRQPPVPGEYEDDTEPTLDLSDELALVRAIQDIPVATGSEPPAVVGLSSLGAADDEATIAEVVQFSRGPKGGAVQDDAEDDDTEVRADADRADADQAESDQADAGGDQEIESGEVPGAAAESTEDEGSALDTLEDIFSDQDPLADAPTGLVVMSIDEETVLEVTAPSSLASDAVPSDASAVPELSPSLRSHAWEPAIVVDYPVEPSEDDGDGDVEVPEGSDDPGRPEPPVAGQDRRDEAATLDQPGTSEATEAPGGVLTHGEGDEPADQLLPLDVPEQPTPPNPPKPARRKRASVPSWDEIVFGGPREK